jgi:hypothetical protein
MLALELKLKEEESIEKARKKRKNKHLEESI